MLERAMRFKVVSAVEAAESLIYTALLATLGLFAQRHLVLRHRHGMPRPVRQHHLQPDRAPPLAAILLGLTAAACRFQPGLPGRRHAEHDRPGVPSHHDRAPAGQERRRLCFLGDYALAVSAGHLQCHGPDLSAGLQRRRQRSRSAALAGGEIAAHQRQHRLAGLRRAVQPEHAHHRCTSSPRKWLPAQPLLYAYFSPP